MNSETVNLWFILIVTEYHKERLMRLWCVYVKADPTDNVGNDEVATKAAQRVFCPCVESLGRPKDQIHLQGVSTCTLHSCTG